MLHVGLRNELVQHMVPACTGTISAVDINTSVIIAAMFALRMERLLVMCCGFTSLKPEVGLNYLGTCVHDAHMQTCT